MIKKLFKPRSLDEILSKFTKTMDDLKAHAEDHHEKLVDKLEKVVKLNAEAKVHERAKERALGIHANFENLLKGNK